MRFGNTLDLPVLAAAPATPPSGRQLIYSRGSSLYLLRNDGTEINLGAAASSVDLTTDQSIAGIKTFTGTLNATGGVGGTAFTSRAENLRANSTLVGGGTLYTTTLPGIRWDARIMSISNGRGAHYGSAGYFDISSPAAGTVITGVGGQANVTVAADGTIPLPGWAALYYILPTGQNNTSLNANFRVVSYTANLEVPADWVLVAVHNSEAATVRWGVGVTMKLGESLNMRNGTGAGQFVDLSSAQSVTGVKTFTARPVFASGWTVNSGQFVGFNAAAATATTTMQSSSTLVFGTSYWDGTTSQGGDSVVLSGQRASTAAGDLYLNSNRPIRASTYTGTSQVGFIINTAAGLSRDIAYQSAGVNRWMMRVSGDAETGNATGSHWQIVSRNDDGSFRHTPLSIGRDTGYVDATIRLTEAGQRVFSLGNKVPINGLTATGTPDANTYLRGDGTWAAPAFAAPANMVTTDTGTTPAPQTITGVKRFESATSTPVQAVSGTWTDPEPGVARAIKIGAGGMALLGGLKVDTLDAGTRVTLGPDGAATNTALAGFSYPLEFQIPYWDGLASAIATVNLQGRTDEFGNPELYTNHDFRMAGHFFPNAIYADGVVESNTLRLRSTSDAAPDIGATPQSQNHGLQIGPDSGQNLRIDNNEIISVNNGAGAVLILQKDTGSYVAFGGTGYESDAMRVGAASVDVAETTTSTTFTNLTTVGPDTTCVVPPSGQVLVMVSCQVLNATTTTTNYMSFDLRVDNATGTLVAAGGASDSRSGAASGAVYTSAFFQGVYVGLTPGTVLHLRGRYRAGTAGTAQFRYRRALLMPLP